MAQRFVEGHELAARHDRSFRDPVRDALALFDALAALGEIHPAVIALRERDDTMVRERWTALRRAFASRG